MNIGVLILRDGSHLKDHMVRFQFLVENFKAQNSTQLNPNFSNCRTVMDISEERCFPSRFPSDDGHLEGKQRGWGFPGGKVTLPHITQ